MNDGECQNSYIRKLAVLTAIVSSDTDAISVKELSQRLSLHINCSSSYCNFAILNLEQVD